MPGPGGEVWDMARSAVNFDEPGLAPEQPACADCGRTPLIGETLHRFAGDVPVCELCRPLRRAQPHRSELVRHGEHAATVRIHRRGAPRPAI